MKNSNYQIRPTQMVPFTELGRIQSLRTEQLVISCERNIDIGAWCYRGRSAKSTLGRGKAVDLSTFDKSRPEKLRVIIDCLFDEISHLREASQGDHLHNLTRFLDWCDEHGSSDVFENHATSRNAYKAYCTSLRDRCARGRLELRTAGKSQAYLLRLFKNLYDDTLFGDGIRTIKAKSKEFNTTNPQDESDQAEVLAWCQAIFDGFTDFVLAEDEFPFKLSTPKKPEWDNNFLWVFPCSRMMMTPDTLAIRDTLASGNWAFNYENGTLNSKDSITHRYKDTYYSGQSARSVIRAASIKLSNVNTDPRHHQRKRLAKTASLAFLHLLYANTGQNSTPLQSMRLPEDYEVGAERQGFRVVKNRGNKGEILFEVQNTFLPQFKKYLELRDWLLKDTENTELLFFATGVNNRQPPHAWAQPTESFKSNLRAIGIKLPKFGARQFRANKNEYANNHTDLATAAKAANHTVETHKNNYMSGTKSKQTQEVGVFFSAVSTSAMATIAAKQDVGLGRCSDPDKPDQLHIQSSIPPNCGQPEGCLSCKNFFVHPDEEDIRKLASGRYVIQRTQHLADTKEHFDHIFLPVFERIADLLNEISERSNELRMMVVQIVKEVNEEQNLSEFWASELRYLIELDLVNE